MEILITDVTEMHQGSYCVAGWSAARSCMVRLLPNGANWTGLLLAVHGIHPGATIGVTARSAQACSLYPHRTEDTPIDRETIVLVSPGPEPWFGANAPPVVRSLAAAFQQQVLTTGMWNGAKKGAYVQEGTQVSSLAAVRISRGNLQFYEDNFNGKRSLPAYMTDTDGRYSLPVVARSLRELYRANGTMAVNQSLPTVGDLHVRLGLARAWPGQPGKCTVMINGVYW